MKKLKKANKQNTQELKFSLITLVFVVFCSFLLVIATFTQLKIYFPTINKLEIINYIPQIPTVLFIAGLLGKRYGTLSVLIYVFTGLFLAPVFALGGGLDYILNFNFGYILGFIFATIFAAKIIETKITILKTILASITGVLTIHITGIIYLTIILLIEHSSIQNILSWITNQSINTILIDITFGLGAFALGNLLKLTIKKIA